MTIPTIFPGDLHFAGPTERPDEPVTAGLPIGAGPGPEVLNLPSETERVAGSLRAMYAAIPAAQNDGVLRVLERAEQRTWR
jgi:hypothetical protein